MNNKKTIIICNILCAALMLALLICQCLPFWVNGADQASIQEFTWFPHKNKDISKLMKELYGKDFMLKDIVLMPVATFFAGVFGFFFCAFQPKKTWICLLPLFCGVMGVWGYLTTPAMQLNSMWYVHLALCALMIVAAIIPIILLIKEVVTYLSGIFVRKKPVA